MDIEANVKSISKLKDFFFIVPDYQREYVWKPDDQVEQFLIDIDNEFDPRVIDQKGYFIGSIIIVKNKGKYDVIDGQQRLTTILLALCAYRDLLKNQVLDKKQKKYYQTIEELLCDFDINTDETLLRLELQYEESHGFLTHLIEEIPYTDAQTSSVIKMQQAFDKIKGHLTTYLNRSLNELIAYTKYFLTKIELVVIESENLSSALKIFETINQRGAGLNAMDLVKNLLFSESSETDFQTIKETWKEITKNLQSCGEEQSPLRFLRYFIMSRYHEGVLREDDIYKWIISREGKAATQYESAPLALAKELKQISKRYASLAVATELKADGGDYPSVTNIGFINKAKSRQHIILLLALAVDADKTSIEYLAKQIESFFFYSNTLGIQAKNNERIFTQWAVKLRALKTIQDISNVIDATMLPYLQKRLSEFKSSFKNIRHYHYNPLYRQRFVLGQLENTALLAAGLPINGHAFYAALQVEHILPQTPKDGIISPDYRDVDDYYDHVYRMGNVALLEGVINQALSNCNDMTADWFDQKQKEYAKSNCLTVNLLDDEYGIGNNTAVNRFKMDHNYVFAEWNKETIQRRQEIMLELAFSTWRLNDKRIDK